MKKILSLVLALTMVAAMAACAPADTDETTTTPTETTVAPTTEPVVVVGSALEILETVWGQFGDDEKFFVMGGDYTNPVDGAPGAVNVADVDYLTGTLLVPADQTEGVTEAASMMHAMMANNFTCGAFKVADAAAFAEAMHGTISTNPWICGMPEKLVIATIGTEYVVALFGINDAVNPFEAKLTAAYPEAELVYSEAITG